ncbi:MAG TPA: Uma2 family endonuclease, partial [Tepidiformaceae bacterium]|nr:Uma2 family endonuclease [Tepidiformaceae bacterium]
MTRVQRLITVDEFFALPDPPQGGKMELVDGRVVTMSLVGREHAALASRLDRALGNFADQHALGEVGVEGGFRLFPDRSLVRAPDAHWVAAERLS